MASPSAAGTLEPRQSQIVPGAVPMEPAPIHYAHDDVSIKSTEDAIQLDLSERWRERVSQYTVVHEGKRSVQASTETYTYRPQADIPLSFSLILQDMGTDGGVHHLRVLAHTARATFADGKPIAPTLGAIASSEAVHLFWKPIPYVDEYTVSRDGKPLAVVAASEFTDTGLPVEGGPIDYEISAVS